MLMPTIFRRDLFDDMFDTRFNGYQSADLMRTDVKETETGYEVSIDMPGVKKEDVKAELNDGYLTISAEVNQDNDEKDSDGKYIRQERYRGSFSRSFYVGDEVAQSDIKAKFEDGTLMLLVPKKESAPQIEEKKYIPIEG
jgi:HSP20 family protein